MKFHLKSGKTVSSKWFAGEFIIYLVSRFLAGALEAEIVIKFKWKDDPNLYLIVNCAAIIFTVAIVLLFRKLFRYKKDGDDLLPIKTLVIASGIALISASALILLRFV